MTPHFKTSRHERGDGDAYQKRISLRDVNRKCKDGQLTIPHNNRNTWGEHDMEIDSSFRRKEFIRPNNFKTTTVWVEFSSFT